MEQVGATEAFVRERDDVLLSLDYERLKAFCAAVDDIAAALRAAEAMLKWRPIETAPKDGPVLIYDPLACEPFVYVCSYADFGDGEPCWVEHADGQSCEPMPGPTHWMPLPAPPFPAEREAECEDFASCQRQNFTNCPCQDLPSPRVGEKGPDRSELNALIEKARARGMTDEERAAQRESFVKAEMAMNCANEDCMPECKKPEGGEGCARKAVASSPPAAPVPTREGAE